MADIRVERKGGAKVWQWVFLALIILAIALFVLYQAGYAGVATQVDATAPLVRLVVSTASAMQEVLYG
jgi:uncharacterized protein YpmS